MSNLAYWQMRSVREYVDGDVFAVLRDWESDVDSFNKSVVIMAVKVNTARESRKRLVCLNRASRKAFFAMYQTTARYRRKLDAVHAQLIIAENFNPTDPSIQKALEIIEGE